MARPTLDEIFGSNTQEAPQRPSLDEIFNSDPSQMNNFSVSGSQQQGQATGGQIQSQTSTTQSQQSSPQDQQTAQKLGNQAFQDATLNSAFAPLGGANFVKAGMQGVQQVAQGLGEVGQGIHQAFGQGKPTGQTNPGLPTEKLNTPGLATQQQMQEGSQKSFKGLEDIIGGGLGTVFSPISGAIESIPDEHIKGAVKALANVPSWAVSSIGKWAAKQVNPNLSEDELEQNVGKPLSLATNLGLTQFAPEAAEATGKVLGKAGEIAGKALKGSGEVTKSALSMASSLGKGAIDTAIENPEALGEAQKAGIESSRAKTLEMIKNPIDQMKADLSDNGKAYQPIRDTATPVNLGENWLDNQLQQHGLTVDENGQLQGTTKSAVRNPSDIAPIQKFYNLWKDKGNGVQPMDSDEFLNMRSDLADLANYDKLNTTGKTAASENFAQNTRDALNEVGRPQIDGLEQLDNTHSDLINRLDDIKNTIYKNDGTLKDNAVSNVNNLLNKGKEGLMGKIQEAIPDFDMDKFAKQVKVTKALEDIDVAKQNKIGAYTHNILTGASALTGNVPGIMASILTHPTILIPILQKAGEIAGKTSEFVSDISDKMMEGEKPTGEAAQFVTKALKQAKPAFVKGLVYKAATPNQQ